LRNVVTRLRCFVSEEASSQHFEFVQASEDLRLRFWSVEHSNKLSVKYTIHAGREQVVSLDLSPQGLVALGTKGFDHDDCKLTVWDVVSKDYVSSTK